MKHFLVLLLSLFIFQSAQAESNLYETPHKISVEKAYAYPTSKMQKNGAVFMALRNTMPKPDRLIAVYADGVADRAELHTHEMDGDVMMMRKTDGFDLLGGQVTKLEPAGHHIMLMGLKLPLTAGQSFRLTLDFEHEDDITITVPVTIPQDLQD